MANSLQEQLLKAGLTDEKAVKKTNKAKRKQAKQQRHSKTETVDENKQQAKQTLNDKAQHDRELNRKRDQQAQQKAITAQIKQLISLNRISKNNGGCAYNFTDQKKIKKIFVETNIVDQLSNGRLAIVKLGEQYEIIPQQIADKIRQRDESVVIVCNEPQQQLDDDDPYADYQIPDDLMW